MDALSRFQNIYLSDLNFLGYGYDRNNLQMEFQSYYLIQFQYRL